MRRLATDTRARIEDELAAAWRSNMTDVLCAGVLHGPQTGDERRIARRVAEVVERECAGCACDRRCGDAGFGERCNECIARRASGVDARDDRRRLREPSGTLGELALI